MKNHDINDLMPLGEAMNESQRDTRQSACSNGKLNSVSWQKIAVQFAPLSEPVFEINIRRVQKRPAAVRPLDSVMLLAAAQGTLVTMY